MAAGKVLFPDAQGEKAAARLAIELALVSVLLHMVAVSHGRNKEFATLPAFEGGLQRVLCSKAGNVWYNILRPHKFAAGIREISESMKEGKFEKKEKEKLKLRVICKVRHCRLNLGEIVRMVG